MSQEAWIALASVALGFGGGLWGLFNALNGLETRVRESIHKLRGEVTGMIGRQHIDLAEERKRVDEEFREVRKLIGRRTK